jgi:NAD(P)H-hydrate epimerase
MEKYSADNKGVVMSRDEVRAVDSWAINEVGVPGVVLMENAGRSCAELIREKLGGVARPKVVIFCGTGNNGGDGYVIARHLLNSGYEVVVVICGDYEKIGGDARINLDIIEKLRHPIERVNPKGEGIAQRVKELCEGADMIVDGLFGTGLAGELQGGYRGLIEGINEQKCPILAVDIPSGLDCDTGEPLGAAIKADYTVTFVAAKKGFAKPAARKYMGEIYVASIGVEPADKGGS